MVVWARGVRAHHATSKRHVVLSACCPIIASCLSISPPRERPLTTGLRVRALASQSAACYLDPGWSIVSSCAVQVASVLRTRGCVVVLEARWHTNFELL